MDPPTPDSGLMIRETNYLKLESMPKTRTMKTLIRIAACLALTACTVDTPPLGGRGVGDEVLDLRVSAGGFASADGSAATRATDIGYATSFAAGDCIGLFAIVGSTVHDDNVKYSYDGNQWEVAEGGDAVYRYPGATYLAYYPYDPAMDGKSSLQEIFDAFAPKTDQSTQADYTASDLMTGSGTVTGSTLNISLGHTLSLLEIALPSTASEAKLSVDGVELKPYAWGNNIYRALVKPTGTPQRVDGSYKAYDGKRMAFSKSTNFTQGQYTRFSIYRPRISGGYTGPMTVKYTDNGEETVTISADGLFQLAAEGTGKTIHRITLNGHEYLIGRTTDQPLLLNVDASGNLHFRPTDESGNIPIGAYAEFQLINMELGGQYKQEADLDLMNEEWTPIGNSYDMEFTGTFNGGGYKLANLKINRTGTGAGLFGYTAPGATLKNIAVVSGSVKAKIPYSGGGVCGQNRGTITACYNSSDVSAERVGGVCGNNFGSITACYNTGSVSEGIEGRGGVCGQNNYPNASITACYNTSSEKLCGYNLGSITACYVVSDPTNGGTVFSAGAWPTTNTHTAWGIGNSDGTPGNYWKSLGSWNDGNPVFPKLWFE
jgi:hypothetical protein